MSVVMTRMAEMRIATVMVEEEMIGTTIGHQDLKKEKKLDSRVVSTTAEEMAIETIAETTVVSIAETTDVTTAGTTVGKSDGTTGGMNAEMNGGTKEGMNDGMKGRTISGTGTKDMKTGGVSGEMTATEIAMESFDGMIVVVNIERSEEMTARVIIVEKTAGMIVTSERITEMITTKMIAEMIGGETVEMMIGMMAEGMNRRTIAPARIEEMVIETIGTMTGPEKNAREMIIVGRSALTTEERIAKMTRKLKAENRDPEAAGSTAGRGGAMPGQGTQQTATAGAMIEKLMTAAGVPEVTEAAVVAVSTAETIDRGERTRNEHESGRLLAQRQSRRLASQKMMPRSSRSRQKMRMRTWKQQEAARKMC